MENGSRSLLTAVVVGGLFLVGSAGMRAYGEVAAQKAAYRDTIGFTGTAEREVESDRIKWSVQLSRTGSNLRTVSTQMTADQAALLKLLADSNVSTTDVSVQPVTSSIDAYSKTAYINQIVVIESKDVGGLANLQETASTKMAQRGVVMSTIGNEFTVSNLPAIQKELVLEALNDAQKQAEQVPGIKVGKLQNAANANFAATPVNSSPNASSYYGMYGNVSPDTQSIKKKVTATIYASYRIN